SLRAMQGQLPKSLTPFRKRSPRRFLAATRPPVHRPFRAPIRAPHRRKLHRSQACREAVRSYRRLPLGGHCEHKRPLSACMICEGNEEKPAQAAKPDSPKRREQPAKGSLSVRNTRADKFAGATVSRQLPAGHTIYFLAARLG